MGRLSGVSWPSYLIVLSLSIFAILMIWLIRCIIRYNDNELPSDEEIWSADMCDVSGGISLFIIVSVVGIVYVCSSSPQHVVLITDSHELLSADLPLHITPVQRWRKKRPQIPLRQEVPVISKIHLQVIAPDVPTDLDLIRSTFATAERKHTSHIKDPFAPILF
jgi:hypothetical protein